MSSRHLLIVAVVAVFSSAVHADTIYVDAANCPGPGTGDLGDPYCSIQDAIDAAVSGIDYVEVATGTYFEAIDFAGKAITLYSVGGPDATIIDGTGFYHVVKCVSGEGPDTVLDGFTITGGNAGGVFPDGNGGGMYNDASSPTVLNCRFVGNTAADAAGAMYNTAASPALVNCVFSGNSTWLPFSVGGAMLNVSGSDATITNCTFYANSTDDDGGGGAMYNSDSNPTVVNSILRVNFPDEIVHGGTGSTTVTYSNVQGGHAGAGNIDADPLFVDADGPDLLAGTPDDNHRLARFSPSIDAGDNTAVPLAGDPDPDGNPRFVDDGGVIDSGNGTAPIVDMGPYERQVDSSTTVIQVPLDAPTIQAGIDDAIAGDEVVAAPGTYTEAIDFAGKAITVRSSDGPTVTIIDGAGADHVVQCVTGEGPGTVLEGFTITGGNADGALPDNRGAGMFNSTTSPTVRNCVFSGNIATNLGGGMYNFLASPALIDCMFVGNAGFGAGGMYNTLGNPTLTNCLFSGNTAATGDGGGVLNNTSSPTVINCSFSGNTAAGTGGGMHNVSGSNPIVINCVLWGDSPDEIYNDASTPTVTYSNVQGGFAGLGNIDADPVFVDPNGDDNTIGTPDDELRLKRFSPCTDAGDNDAVPGGITTDLDGNPRFFDDLGVADTGSGTPPVVDMGAYERQEESLPVIMVWPGDSIQDAIVEAVNGEEVVVNPGTYVEAIDFIGKAITVRSTDPTNPAVVAATIIDGNNTLHVVQCVSGEGPETVLDGFTITGGNADAETSPDDSGGGMYISGSSPTVSHCTFIGNDAIYGGGMNNTNSSPTVSGCTFIDNRAKYYCDIVCIGANGGGVFNSGSTPTFTDCAFIDNTASSRGGGMYNTGSSPTLKGCMFHSNSAGEGGGGMYILTGSPTLTDCTFTSNLGGLCCVSDAGGIQGGTPTVMNCIFSGNQNAGLGGGNPQVTNCIFSANEEEGIQSPSNATIINCTFYANGSGGIGGFLGPGRATVTNCIVWGNGDAQLDLDQSSVVTYSIVEGGYAGTGNIDADPMFLDAAGGNYRLNPFSPAVETGDNSALPADVADLDGDGDASETLPYDADGYDRVVNGDDHPLAVVDIGAFEFAVETTTGAVVQNVTQITFFETIPPAMIAAAPGDHLLASPPAFSAAPTVDFLGKSLVLRSTGSIDQPAGGQYVLADDATLASAAGQDITLAGELRVKNGDAADVTASQLIASAGSELVARTGAGLFITTDNGVTLDGDATLLDGAAMGFGGGVAIGGSLTAINNATIDASGPLTSTGTVSLLNGVTLLADSVGSSGLMQMSDVTVLASGFTNQPGGEVVVSGDIFSDVANDALLTCIGATLVVGDYTNNDTTIVQIGTLTIVGTLTNNGTIIGDVVSGLGPGGGTQPGDGLDVTGDYVAGPNASLSMPDPVWLLTVGGDYDVAVNDNGNYNMVQAELRMSGSDQALELMSEDIGADPAGLNRTLPGHYPIGTLRIGPSTTTVSLVDNHDNDGFGQGLCEAIYVQQLIVEPGATLNTLTCRVYYDTAQIDGVVDDPANLIALPAPCLWDCQTTPDGEVNIPDFLKMLAEWGGPGSCDFDGDGVDVNDFLILLGNWGPCP